MYILLLCVFCCVATSTNVNEFVQDDAMHDNWIYFDSNATVRVSFAVTNFVISSGQPYGGISTSGNGILIKAGRHGSAPPAAAFVNGITLVNMMATEHWFDTEPADLNFAAFGVFNISIGNSTFILKDARIGQGHYGFTNNWWFGALNCITAPLSSSMTCGDLFGAKFQIHTEGKSDRYYILPVSQARNYD